MNDQKAFDCKMCGHCCEGRGGIVLAAKDRVRLAAYLGMTEESMLARFAETVSGRVRLVAGDDNFCIFYADGAGCTVHEGRPDICRAWPFFRGNLLDAGSWEMVQTDCPGINAQAGHDEFRRQGVAYVRALRVDESDPDAPVALKDLPEPD